MARPIRVTISYVLDWIVVIAFAAAGGGLNYITGFHRPFSLSDNALAYPLKANIISYPVVVIIALVAPVIIIAALNAITVFTAQPTKSRNQTAPGLRGKLRAIAWETHVGWLGLCTGLAVTLFITTGLKDVIGKPRPDLLARCAPDLANIDKYIIGGFGMGLESDAPPLVSSAICQQPDTRLLDDGFASFPSGHSSFSSAGMVYLTLWLCARWSVAIPFLNYSPLGAASTSTGGRRTTMEAQTSRAAPPLWQLALAFTPVFVALFVSASRYADFHHAGFDIIAGMVLGTVCGWASFRLYHMPTRRAGGLLAWGPRPERHAFLANTEGGSLVLDDDQGRDLVDHELGFLGPDRRARIPTADSHRHILEESSGASPPIEQR